MTYAIAVLGAGPIGAATAYQLALRGVPGVALACGGPEDGAAAYPQSGGSVCWHRPDPAKAAAIEETASYLRSAVAAGAPIRYRSAPYLLLESGALAPALNVTAADLVSHLRVEAERRGVATVGTGRVRAVAAAGTGYRVVGDRSTVDAQVVVLALGAGNLALAPGLPRELEKRQLFVLDLPVDEARAGLPHIVAPVGDGYAYCFVKEFDAGLRLVLGQEELVTDDDMAGPVDYLDTLLARVGPVFPFLAGARAERILWGPDWTSKAPSLGEQAPGLITVNCGSAVRACLSIGRAAAGAATAALRRVSTC
jgi:glycine/D-amino acid oxidase-like deaminating enzyme